MGREMYGGCRLNVIMDRTEELCGVEFLNYQKSGGLQYTHTQKKRFNYSTKIYKLELH